MKYIISGYEIIISSCDTERVMAHKWVKQFSTRGKYFSSYFPDIKRRLTLHRYLTNCPKGMLVDHINGNMLDNRQENLRVCNSIQNGCNRSKQKNNKSGYKGVYQDKKTKRWKAYIRTKGKDIHLGYFETPEKAYEAYSIASKKYHGEYGHV